MTASLTSEPVVLALHPNNSQLILGTQAGEAVVMDVLTGEIAFSLPRHATAVTSAAFSPDGNWLATGSADGSVRLWDAFTGSKRLELGRHESAVVFLSCNTASDRVISASQNGVARVSVIRTTDVLALAQQRVKRGFTTQELQDYHIEASSGYQPASPQAAIETPAPRVISLPVIPTPELPTPQPVKAAGQAITVGNVAQMVELGSGYIGYGVAKAVSPDGRFIISPSSLSLTLYDLLTMQIIWQKTVGYFVDQEISFSPDGSLIAAPSNTGDVHLVRVEDGVEVKVLKGHTKDVRGAKFSPDGKLLATCSFDDLILLWSIPEGELVGKLANQPFAKGVVAISFSPDGKTLASGSTDGKVRIWDIERQNVIQEFSVGEYFAMSVAYSPDGSTLITEDYSNTVGPSAWRAADGTALFPIQGREPRFSPDGSMIVTRGWQFDENGQLSGILYFLDTQDGEVIATFPVRPFSHLTMGFTGDQRLFYVVTLDGILHLWGVP